MEAWTASKKLIFLPTLSEKLALDTEMGEAVIWVSNTSESLSIRASLFSGGSCYVTDRMTGSMAVMKNTREWAEEAWVWFIVELQFEGNSHANFQRSNYLKKHRIMTRPHSFIYTRFWGRGKVVWDRLLFALKCIWWCHVVPSQNHGIIFGLPSIINLCASSQPKMIPERWFAVLAICVLSGPINSSLLLDLASSH